MVNELAVGYVSIVAETSRLGAQIAREFGGVQRAAVAHGRGIGTALSRGIAAAKPVDLKDLETRFATAEKSRAAVVKRTTSEIEGLRRKEAIAQATLAAAEAKSADTVVKARDLVVKAEAKYGTASAEARAAREKLTAAEKTAATGSVAVLRAKDQLATAAQKIALAEAKQTVEVKKADDAVKAAKKALDDIAATGGRGFKDIAAQAGAAGRTIGTSLGKAGRDVGSTFRKIATGDVRGAFTDMRDGATKAAGGVTGAFGRVRGFFSGLRSEGGRAGTDTGKGFAAALDREFAAGAAKAGSSFKANLGAALAATGITRIFDSALGAIKGAWSGGFDRVMNIQNAEIKLDTLAQSAGKKLGLTGAKLQEFAKQYVGSSMDSVSAAVDGTKFAISDAADMASTLGAAGIEAGDDMTRWLKITADAAQFNNREFGDMQQVLGKVAAQGKVTGETFDSLPIAASALADHLGLTQEEVRKLASEGKISANDLRDALEGVIGGAAANAGASFLSLRDNIKSAMNATMAHFIKPITTAMMPIMSAGLGLLKMFRDDVAKPLGVSLGEFLQPKAEAFAAVLGRIPDTLTLVKSVLGSGEFKAGLGFEEDSKFVGFLQTVRDGFTAAKHALAGFLKGFGGLGKLGPSLTLLTGPLGLLKTVLVEVFKDLDFAKVGQIVGAGLKPIAEAASSLAGVLTGTLVKAIAGLAPVLGNIAVTLLPVLGAAFADMVPLIGEVIGAVVPLVGHLVSQLAPILIQLAGQVVPPLLGLVRQLAPVILGVVAAVLPLVAQLASALVPAITDVVSTVAPLITQLVTGLAPIVTELFATVLPPLVDALSDIVDVIRTNVLPVLVAFVRFMTSNLQVALKALMPVVKVVFGAIAGTIKNAMRLVAGIIRTVTAIIRGDWSGAWKGIRQVATAIWDQIKLTIKTAINLVRTTISGVVSIIKDGWSRGWRWIGDKASSIWRDKIVAPIKDRITSIRTTISETLTRIKDGWTRGWNGIKDAGQRIWDGIKGVFAKPINAVIGFVNDGIIGGYNWVAGKFGLDKLGTISRVGGYARGGILPGTSTYRQGDDQLIMARRGEGITVTEALDSYERRRLLSLNAAVLRGERPAEFRRRWGDTEAPPGFAGGGIVSYKGKRFTPMFAQSIQNAERISGTSFHISQGGFRPRTSYSGTSHQGDALDMTPITTAIITALRASGIAAWDRTGKGNWAPHIHGVPLPGFGRAAGSAIWQAQDYLRGGDGLGGRDNGPKVAAEQSKGLLAAIEEGFNTVKEWFGAIGDKITGPFQSLMSNTSGPLGDLVTAVGRRLKDELTSWVKSKIGLDSSPRGYATGTASATPGWAWAGERGPELIRFRGGEKVLTNSESMAALGGPTRLAKEDLDYLAGAIARILWPTARAADIVHDLASNGQSRQRRLGTGGI